MKILLVYNPQAGHKRAKIMLPRVEASFISHQIDFELALTDYPEHATEIVQSADFNNYDGIVAAGGDGVLFEVINGYFKNTSSKRIPVGVLPIGTGNAFARDLALDKTKWEEAVKIISQQKPRKVDVGKFITHGQTYYFVNILGLGFVADVGEIARKLKLFGNISYTLGVLYRTLFLKSNHLRIDIDGTIYERENIFVEISNTRYTADFLMAPFAEIDDGLLDITLLGKVTRRKLLQSFPSIFKGEHIYLDEIETFKARRINIQSDVVKVLTPDGELIGVTPVAVECLPRALEVFWK